MIEFKKFPDFVSTENVGVHDEKDHRNRLILIVTKIFIYIPEQSKNSRLSMRSVLNWTLEANMDKYTGKIFNLSHVDSIKRIIFDDSASMLIWDSPKADFAAVHCHLANAHAMPIQLQLTFFEFGEQIRLESMKFPFEGRFMRL